MTATNSLKKKPGRPNTKGGSLKPQLVPAKNVPASALEITMTGLGKGKGKARKRG